MALVVVGEIERAGASDIWIGLLWPFELAEMIAEHAIR